MASAPRPLRLLRVAAAPSVPPPLLRGRHRRCPPPHASSSPSPSPSTAAGSHTAPGVLARWLFDCRYGTRTEATALLQEWVSTVGAKAGAGPSNTRLSAGAVGVPESRLELELALPSLAAWEEFLGRIDRQAHRAWSERAARLMVDGSTRWEVLRVVPVGGVVAGGAAAQAPAQAPYSNNTTDSGLVFSPPGATIEAAAAEARGDPPKPRDAFADALMSALGVTSGGSGGSEQAQEAAAAAAAAAEAAAAGQADDEQQPGGEGAAPLLDWKGEPMQINPGDKLPFKFL